MPDMAVIDTDTDFFASATPDGITRWGALEQCVRAGMTDNSHIGANGGPTLVRIGQTNVFIDVPHGVHNRAVSDPACDRMALRYFAYFRVKDALTGAPLYYSEEPILDHDALWREYVEEGAWVSRLDHLDGVMFAGGHVPVDPDKCSENDLFCLYTGVGDTAVARAEFRIRDLLPECALEDIRRLDQFKQQRLKTVSPLRIHFPAEASGWQWYADNDIDKRAISITRLLDRNGYHEVECSFVYPRPGYFDSVMTTLATESIEMFDDLGWLVAYRGVRWDTEEGKQVTRVGFGFLLLEPDNPQRIIFRSGSSLVPPAVLDGWVAGTEILPPSQMLDKPLDHIPERVVAEIRRTRECAQKGIAFSTQFTDWLKKKAAFWNPTR
jgi:hypothetical protein